MFSKPSSGRQALSELLSPELAAQVEATARDLGLTPQEYVARVLHKATAQQTPHPLALPASGAHSRTANAVYLSAPVSALVEGLYRQSTTLEELSRWGDFGLGTFNELDGEMLLMDGAYYQMRADGQVSRIAADAVPLTRTPFACVTFFQADTHDHIGPEMGRPELFSLLDSLLPSPNMLYAIRVEGSFASLRVRSVPPQEDGRPLAEVAREQPEFSFQNILGSMVGFYTPPMMQGLSVPGLHLHFIDASGKHGGHLLDCRIEDAQVAVQHVPRLVTGLPVSLDYLTADFTRDVGKDLDEAER